MNIYNENYYLDFYNSELEKSKLLLNSLTQNNYNLLHKFKLLNNEIKDILENATIKTVEELLKSLEINLPKLKDIDELINFSKVVIEPELLETFNSIKNYVYDNTSIESIDNIHNQIQELIKQNYYLKNLKSTTIEKEIQLNKKIESENLLKVKQAQLEKEKIIENQKQIELDKLIVIENTELAKKETTTTLSNNKLKEQSLKKTESENLLKVKQLEKEKFIEKQKQIELDKLKAIENTEFIKRQTLSLALELENSKLKLTQDENIRKELELKSNEVYKEMEMKIQEVNNQIVDLKYYKRNYYEINNERLIYDELIFGSTGIEEISKVKVFYRTQNFVILKIDREKRKIFKIRK